MNSLNFKEDKINVISSEFFILSECLYNPTYEIDGNIIKNSFIKKSDKINVSSTLESSIKRLKDILWSLDINLKLFF